MTGKLGTKIVRSGYWITCLRVSNRGLGFLRTVILARLLMPHDYGLIGIAMLAISTSDALSQTGFQNALIRKKELNPEDLNTAWTVSIVRGLLLFAILFVTAPVIADFFQAPMVEVLIKVIAVSFLLNGTKNIGIIYFQKDLNFHRHFLIEISGTAIDLIVSVSFALLYRNVWALVWGGLGGNFVRTVLSYLLHPYRPRFELARTSLNELFTYGKWIFLTGILYALLAQIDSLMVGKLLGTTALGYYQMALMIAFLASSELSSIAALVMFPAYSILQWNQGKLREAYLNLLQMVAFLSLPLYGFLFSLAPELVKLLLGDRWLPLAPCLQILSISGIFVSLAYTVIPVFHAIGKPNIETFLQGCNFGAILLVIYPLIKGWGLNGVALAVLIGNTILLAGSVYMVTTRTQLPFYDYVRKICFPVLNTLLLTIMVHIIRTCTVEFHRFDILVLAVAATLFYGILAFLCDKYLNYGMIDLIKRIAKNN